MGDEEWLWVRGPHLPLGLGSYQGMVPHYIKQSCIDLSTSWNEFRLDNLARVIVMFDTEIVRLNPWPQHHHQSC